MEKLKEMLAFTGIDVDKLVDDYVWTLHNNNNPEATREAAVIALKEYATDKEWLIRQVMAMPGYNGNLQSVIKIQIPLERRSEDVVDAVNKIWKKVFKNGDKILSRFNEDGKSIEDMIAEELKEYPSKIRINSIAGYSGKKFNSYDMFTQDGFTKESSKKKDTAQSLINLLKRYDSSRLDEETADAINKLNPSIRAASGMKTTRALGKIIKFYGLEDKTSGSVYTKEFIMNYCEIMKDGGPTYTFVISVHPVDYLKMSIGKFTSCHNINGGGWRSGCISYMLDSVSMITYAIQLGSETIDPITGELVTGMERPELFSKIYRNVFHWDDKHRLIQSRVYPQGQERCTDLYKAFRLAVQAQISKANGWNSDNWTNRKRKYISFTSAGENATNYADWSYESYGGNLSTPGSASDSYSTEPFVIGKEPTCIVCGNKHYSSRQLKCSNC